MRNLTWIARFILVFIAAITLVDLVSLLYTYTNVSHAMDDTLNTIAQIVAEENCLDNKVKDSSGTTQAYRAKEIMVDNCPLWLTYNNYGVEGYTISASDDDASIYNGYAAGKPTSLRQDYGANGWSTTSDKLSKAISNIDMSGGVTGAGNISGTHRTSTSIAALTLQSDDGSNCWSYETCPQRGHNITIKLTGYYNTRILFPWLRPEGLWINFPITREITVSGMKFYKGKGE